MRATMQQICGSQGALEPDKISGVLLELAPGAKTQQVRFAVMANFPGVKVVSAFQNVSERHLRKLDHPVDCDVLVCGDDAKARETVVGLAHDIGLTAWHAGALANSAAVEAITSVLIAINKRYKVPASGIRITGVPPDKKG